MGLAERPLEHHRGVDLALRHVEVRVPGGDEEPLQRALSHGPVGQRRMAQPVEREVLALAIVGE